MRYFRQKFALWLLIIVGVVLLYSLLPFTTGILSAFVLLVIFGPFYDFLVDHKMNKKISAALTIVLSMILIVLPFTIIGSIVVGQANEFLKSRENIVGLINSVDNFFPEFDLVGTAKFQLDKLLSSAQVLLLNLFKGFTNALLNVVVMYFLLYYLFLNKEQMHKHFDKYVPFKKKNSNRLIDQFKKVTNSTLLTSGLIALIQGILITVGFLFFGIERAFFWGFISFLLAFIPLVGVPLVWIPASLIFLLQQDYFISIGILVWGLFVSNIDNFLRPYIQQKVGKIHPLIILLGVFIGIPLFGFIGIIMGPLMISYFLLLSSMFIEEHLGSI